jgi:hypothetical protein
MGDIRRFADVFGLNVLTESAPIAHAVVLQRHIKIEHVTPISA